MAISISKNNIKFYKYEFRKIPVLYYIGYDLINEPWAGDIYSNPSLLLPGAAGRENIMPMYDKLNDAIRKVRRTYM